MVYMSTDPELYCGIAIVLITKLSGGEIFTKQKAIYIDLSINYAIIYALLRLRLIQKGGKEYPLRQTIPEFKT